MMGGYWVMFGSGFVLGLIFFMISDLAATLIKYLNKITKKKMESDKINDAKRTTKSKGEDTTC